MVPLSVGDAGRTFTQSPIVAQQVFVGTAIVAQVKGITGRSLGNKLVQTCFSGRHVYPKLYGSGTSVGNDIGAEVSSGMVRIAAGKAKGRILGDQGCTGGQQR